MSRDYASGETVVRMVKDRGHYRLETTGTEFSGAGVETYTIADGDPLSARARVDYRVALGRGEDWDARIDTRFDLTATETDFLLTARAEAHDAGVRVWSKSWEDRIPRDGV